MPLIIVLNLVIKRDKNEDFYNAQTRYSKILDVNKSNSLEYYS